MKNGFVWFLLPALLLSGCTSVRQMTLLQEVTEEHIAPVYPDFVIGIGDELGISIHALNEDAVLPFNADKLYTVKEDGSVELPILGKLNVLGQTLSEVQEEVSLLLEDKVQNAFVTVTLPNASVVLLGEVNVPQQLFITKPITVFEAIGAAHGLTANARISQVEVIRIETDKVRKYNLDLSSKDLFLSPCFYLTKGDVVNVLPLHPKRASQMRVPVSADL